MKRCFVLLSLILITCCPDLRGQSPEDVYVGIHAMIYEADALASSGQNRQALDKYTEAQTNLMRLQRGFPEWSPQVVRFRLNYLGSKIEELRPKVQPQAAPPKPDVTAQPATVAPDLQGEITSLRQQFQHLSEEKKVLEAKLQEALAARPAEIDPRELQRAEGKITELQKANELLQASIAEWEAKSGNTAESNAVTRAEQALDMAKAQLAEQKEVISNLNLEKEALQNQIRNQEKPTTDTAALSKALADLQEAREELEARKQKIEHLEQEKQALQVAMRNQQPVPSVNAAALAKDLDEQKELVRRLTREREALQSQVMKPASESETVAGLRARLAVLEAQKVPFTAEELALMNPPRADIPATPAKAAARQPLATTAPLLAEAQRHFATGEFNQAEQKYLRVIEQDDQNPMALANLAVIQIELNRLDEAEKHVRQALSLSPEDAFSYSTLGQVKYRMGDYEAAAEALSRASQLDPKNAEIQSRLGIVLSQQGLREPAETAFRKALQLQPGYAPAHLNLAVLYASQKPPLGELAKWHYQKALKSGSPNNAEVEKMIESARTVSASE